MSVGRNDVNFNERPKGENTQLKAADCTGRRLNNIPKPSVNQCTMVLHSKAERADEMETEKVLKTRRTDLQGMYA